MTTMVDTKRKALGRGLEALLPQRQAASAGEQPPRDAAGTPLEIPCSLIDRNPFQTRTQFDEVRLEELAQSIRASGVIQPILVRSVQGGRFQLITGERRLMASKRAERATIPAFVRQIPDEQAMEMTVVENLQRADLNPMEQARAYQRLSQEFKMTQEQMATRTGKDRASVANFLRLLRLPEQVQGQVEGGVLSFGHARTLLALETPERINSAATKVVSLSMSVRQTESYVQGLLHPEEKKAKPAAVTTVDPNVREAQEMLRRKLGLKVQIDDKQGKGRVIIEYSGLDDFDAILHFFGAEVVPD